MAQHHTCSIGVAWRQPPAVSGTTVLRIGRHAVASVAIMHRTSDASARLRRRRRRRQGVDLSLHAHDIVNMRTLNTRHTKRSNESRPALPRAFSHAAFSRHDLGVGAARPALTPLPRAAPRLTAGREPFRAAAAMAFAA